MGEGATTVVVGLPLTVISVVIDWAAVKVDPMASSSAAEAAALEVNLNPTIVPVLIRLG